MIGHRSQHFRAPRSAAEARNFGGSGTRGSAEARLFELRRARMAEIGRASAPVRVAAFLTVLSERNRAEGRDPLVIDDVVGSDYVAQQLGLGIQDLALILRQLGNLDLVATAPNGDLLLKNPAALKAMVDGRAAPASTREGARATSDWRDGAIDVEFITLDAD